MNRHSALDQPGDTPLASEMFEPVVNATSVEQPFHSPQGFAVVAPTVGELRAAEHRQIEYVGVVMPSSEDGHREGACPSSKFELTLSSWSVLALQYRRRSASRGFR